MPFKHPDLWFWDSWYIKDGDTYHGYFLQAPRSLRDPEARHMNATQRHAISTDLVHWTDLGTSFEPQRNGPAWDDSTTCTGSVVQDEQGLWHLFYTGTQKSEQSLYQRIGHATSTDLHNWTRLGNGLALDLTGPNADCYETHHVIGHWHDRAMRDPWVMKDPDGDGWLMYFTARVPGVPEPNAAAPRRDRGDSRLDRRSALRTAHLGPRAVVAHSDFRPRHLDAAGHEGHIDRHAIPPSPRRFRCLIA